jgi:hypothetical protein
MGAGGAARRFIATAPHALGWPAGACATPPQECAQFEAEFAEGLARASAEFDLAPAEAVLDRWWGIAALATEYASRS